MAQGAGILFSTFEPSGDALAAAVIAQLRAGGYDAPLFALGGARSETAGANILEQTTHHASMFLETIKHVWSHRERLKRLRQWLEQHPLAALVPTDSPAANWSICQLVREIQPQARIVHLAAPQLWAWAAWRIAKLRRLTDHVLCLLPFEPAWFEPRGVSATFVGHPLFEKPRIVAPWDPPVPRLKLALLPGSRSSEIENNWPTMLAAFDQLKRRHVLLTAQVAALDFRIEGMIHDGIRRHYGFSDVPAGMSIVTGRIDDVLQWADVVLVVSGTATLEVAAYRKPMVVLYNVNWLGYQLVRTWLVTAQTFSLPNLISQWQGEGRAVPELVPHFRQVEPVMAAVDGLLTDNKAWSVQRQALERVVSPFAAQHFGQAAAAQLLKVMG